MLPATSLTPQQNTSSSRETEFPNGTPSHRLTRQFLDAGDSVYRGRIEKRIRHRNSLPSSAEAQPRRITVSAGLADREGL
jgi:hypothetical protein